MIPFPAGELVWILYLIGALVFIVIGAAVACLFWWVRRWRIELPSLLAMIMAGSLLAFLNFRQSENGSFAWPVSVDANWRQHNPSGVNHWILIFDASVAICLTSLVGMLLERALTDEENHKPKTKNEEP